jgi:hypothetical protein
VQRPRRGRSKRLVHLRRRVRQPTVRPMRGGLLRLPDVHILPGGHDVPRQRKLHHLGHLRLRPRVRRHLLSIRRRHHVQRARNSQGRWVLLLRFRLRRSGLRAVRAGELRRRRRSRRGERRPLGRRGRRGSRRGDP